MLFTTTKIQKMLVYLPISNYFFEFHFFIFLQLKTHSMLNSINTVEERLRNAADYNIGGDNNW